MKKICLMCLGLSVHLAAVNPTYTKKEIQDMEKETPSKGAKNPLLPNDFLNIVKDKALKEWSGFFMPFAADLMTSLGIKNDTLKLLAEKRVFVPHDKKVGIAVFDGGVNKNHEFLRQNIHFVRAENIGGNKRKNSIDDLDVSSRDQNYHHAIGIASAIKQIYPEAAIFSMRSGNANNIFLDQIKDFLNLQREKRVNILPHINNPLPISQAKIINFSFSVGGEHRTDTLTDSTKETMLILAKAGNIIVMSAGNKNADLSSSACERFIKSWEDFFQNGVNGTTLTADEKKRFLFVGGTQIKDGKLEKWDDSKHSTTGSSYFSNEMTGNPVYDNFIYAPSNRLLLAHTNNGYFYINGTSNAAPIVCATLAYLVNEFGLPLDSAVEHLLKANPIEKNALKKNGGYIPGRVLDFHKTIEVLKKPEAEDHDPVEDINKTLNQLHYTNPYASHTVVHEIKEQHPKIDLKIVEREIERRSFFEPVVNDDRNYTQEDLEKMSYNVMFMKASDLEKNPNSRKEFDDFKFYDQIKEFLLSGELVKGFNNAYLDNLVEVNKWLPLIFPEFLKKLSHLTKLTIAESKDEQNNAWIKNLKTLSTFQDLKTLEIKITNKIDFLENFFNIFQNSQLKKLQNITIHCDEKIDITKILRNIHTTKPDLKKVEWVNAKGEVLYLFTNETIAGSIAPAFLDGSWPHLKTLVIGKAINFTLRDLIKNRDKFSIDLTEVQVGNAAIELKDFYKVMGLELMIKKETSLPEEDQNKNPLAGLKEDLDKLKKQYTL